jgi:hypothetical protein
VDVCSGFHTIPAGAGGPGAGVVLDLARSAADEGEARAWADDAAYLAWAEGGGGASVIAAELKVRSAALRCLPGSACCARARDWALCVQQQQRGAACCPHAATCLEW